LCARASLNVRVRLQLLCVMMAIRTHHNFDNCDEHIVLTHCCGFEIYFPAKKKRREFGRNTQTLNRARFEQTDPHTNFGILDYFLKKYMQSALSRQDHHQTCSHLRICYLLQHNAATHCYNTITLHPLLQHTTTTHYYNTLM